MSHPSRGRHLGLYSCTAYSGGESGSHMALVHNSIFSQTSPFRDFFRQLCTTAASPMLLLDLISCIQAQPLPFLNLRFSPLDSPDDFLVSIDGIFSDALVVVAGLRSPPKHSFGRDGFDLLVTLFECSSWA